MLTIMQGDSFTVPFKIKIKEGATYVYLTPTELQDVEMCLGGLRKSYADGEITYSADAWHFPVTQAESFTFRAIEYDVQIRAKFYSGDVIGVRARNMAVINSLSKEVL